MLGAFYAGGTLVIARSTDAADVFTTVARERVTNMAAVVPLITTWLNSNVAQQFDVSSLRVVQNGGARLAPELRARLRQRVRLHAAGDLRHRRRPHQHDAARPTATTCCSRARARRSASSTRSRCSTMQDREVPDGEPGELVTRGPYTIRGYYNAPDDQRRGVHGRRLLPDGRHRPEARPLRLHRRPPEGPHQPRRREDQLRRSREPDLRPRPGAAGQRRRDARSGVRRKGLRLRRPAPGNRS